MSDEDKEKIDSQNDPDDGNDSSQDDSATKADDIEKLKEQNKRLFERAKKAEGFEKQPDGSWVKVVKKPETKPEPVGEQTKINAQSPDPDELRLIAKGLSDTEIEQLHVISKGKGISLMESLKDPLFTSFQKDLKEQEKKEKAKLGGSNSSNQGQQGDEPVVKPGMTAEEHKAAWEKRMKG